MNRRFLLLGVAVLTFGAILVSSAIANPSSSVPTNGSTTISVQPLQNLASYLDPFAHDSFIPANGLPHRVDDVYGAEVDPDYAVEVSAAAVTAQGVHTPAGVCAGISATRYTTGPSVSFPTGDIPDGPVGIKVAELYLTLPVTVNNGCQVSGGIVTLTFQAVAGPDS